jgi:hypothetical protein
VLAVDQVRREAQFVQQVGAALLAYVNDNPEDNLYFARTSLGATGYEPARAYLEELSKSGSGQERASAERGLANLNASRNAIAPSANRGR